MGLKCVLGAPISFLLLLFSFLYFTAKTLRLREVRNGLSLQRIAAVGWLKALNLFGLVGILNSLMFGFWSTRLHDVCTKFHNFFCHEGMKARGIRVVCLSLSCREYLTVKSLRNFEVLVSQFLSSCFFFFATKSRGH